MAKIKLTEPQKLLLYLISKGPELVNEDYPPCKRLIELGFAEAQPQGMSSPRLAITMAGEQWLKDQRKGKS